MLELLRWIHLVAAAVWLDGNRARIRLLPFNFLGFLASAVGICRATFNQIVLDRWSNSGLHWDKTVRYRRTAR